MTLIDRFESSVFDFLSAFAGRVLPDPDSQRTLGDILELDRPKQKIDHLLQLMELKPGAARHSLVKTQEKNTAVTTVTSFNICVLVNDPQLNFNRRLTSTMKFSILSQFIGSAMDFVLSAVESFFPS